MNNFATPSGGSLGAMYESATAAFLNKIDCGYHASVYVGEHAPHFAESEFAGKYLDTCVNYTKSLRAMGRIDESELALAHAKQVVDSIIENQREDGYIGGLAVGYELHSFSVWNQAFTLLGLLSYFELTGDRRALECGERIAQYNQSRFMNGADICDGGNNGSQHLSFLLPLVRLCKLSDKPFCRKFADYIVSAIKASDNNFFAFDSILELRSKKGIENFVILIGILEYGELVGDASVISSCEKYWNELAMTQIRENGNGTVREVWTEGGNRPRMLGLDVRPDENCVAVGWIEFSLALYWRTGEAKYIDAVERALYNHLLGAIDETGCDFAYYQPNYGRRITKTEESKYKCCRYRGYSVVSHIPDMLIRREGDAIAVLVYSDAEYEDDQIKLSEKSHYPYESRVSLELGLKVDSQAVKLRVPTYSELSSLTVDGEEFKTAPTDGYIKIELRGRGEHTIELELSSELKARRVNIDGIERIGFTYGCLLLAAEADCADATELAIDTDATIVLLDNEFGFNIDGVRLRDYASTGRAHEFAVWAKVKSDS